jgi:hypothetical protein
MHHKLCILAKPCHLKYDAGILIGFDPLRMALLEQQIKGLANDLSEVVSKLSEEATPKSVHRLRTTIRRIESLISYANPDLGKKLERSLERLGDLRKRAGKVRDIDVQTSLLDQLGNGSTVRDRKTLVSLLGKKRERQVKRLSCRKSRRWAYRSQPPAGSAGRSPLAAKPACCGFFFAHLTQAQPSASSAYPAQKDSLSG